MSRLREKITILTRSMIWSENLLKSCSSGNYERRNEPEISIEQQQQNFHMPEYVSHQSFLKNFKFFFLEMPSLESAARGGIPKIPTSNQSCRGLDTGMSKTMEFLKYLKTQTFWYNWSWISLASFTF